MTLYNMFICIYYEGRSLQSLFNIYSVLETREGRD